MQVKLAGERGRAAISCWCDIIPAAAGRNNPTGINPRAHCRYIQLVSMGISFRVLCGIDGDASKVAPIDKLSVVLVALFAVVFPRERPGAWEWTGILLIGAGVVVLALKR